MSRNDRVTWAAAWLPTLGETYLTAVAIRMRSFGAVVGYRFAAAVSAGSVEPDRVCRVLARAMPDGPVRAFDCYMGGDREPVCDEVKPACEKCGCTEDRACITTAEHSAECASRNAPGNITTVEALARCDCSAQVTGEACAWASREPFICTACADRIARNGEKP